MRKIVLYLVAEWVVVGLYWSITANLLANMLMLSYFSLEIWNTLYTIVCTPVVDGTRTHIHTHTNIYVYSYTCTYMYTYTHTYKFKTVYSAYISFKKSSIILLLDAFHKALHTHIYIYIYFSTTVCKVHISIKQSNNILLLDDISQSTRKGHLFQDMHMFILWIATWYQVWTLIPSGL